MDMNKAFYARKETTAPTWRVIDAEGQCIGRLATSIATMLRGKDRAIFTPHAEPNVYVVVINAEKAVFTGNKMQEKIYQRYTGYIGNRKEFTAAELEAKHPGEALRFAVEGMLPKASKLSRSLERNLKIYAGPVHPHAAQVNV